MKRSRKASEKRAARPTRAARARSTSARRSTAGSGARRPASRLAGGGGAAQRGRKGDRSAESASASGAAELIVRQGFIIDATGRTQEAVPEVLILGNRAGLQYLADLFADLAERARQDSDEPAPSVRIGRLEPPVNARLSDAIEFRFAPLTAANRAATFKLHGITMKSRETGSLFGRYQDVASSQFHKLARKIGVPVQPAPEAPTNP